MPYHVWRSMQTELHHFSLFCSCSTVIAYAGWHAWRDVPADWACRMPPPTSPTVVPGILLQTLISDPPGRGLLVVHLAVQGYEPCNTLDECLDAAAAEYRWVQRGLHLISALLRA